MYTLKINDELFFKPGIEDLSLADIQIKLELNMSGSLTFTMPPTHTFYSKIEQLTTYIELYNDDEWMWGFRILDIDEDFYKIKRVTCEGWLSFLVDTIMRPFERNKISVENFFRYVIDVHNSQVEEEKELLVGTVDVPDIHEYETLNKSSGNYTNNLELIKDKLLTRHQGYLRIRKTEDPQHNKRIDYIKEYNNINTQVIRFGENLLDLNNYIKAGTVKTAIIPLGASIEDSVGINGVSERVTIKSVNDSKDYITNATAISKWGYIWGVVEFDNVTVPSNLLSKAKASLNELLYAEMTIEINALDLSYVNVSAEKIKLGDWISVESIPHDLNKLMLVSSLTLDLNDPTNNMFVLGSTIKTFTGSATNRDRLLSSAVAQVASSNATFINNAVENQTKLLTGGFGGYMVIGQNADGHPNELFFLDTPKIEDADLVLRINRNGIGFSSNGVDGPYGSAWTLDGRFNANYITSGTIKAITLEGNVINNGNGTFKVDVNGNLTASSASITGEIKSGSLITGATINGGNINVTSDVTIGKVLKMSPGQDYSYGGIELGNSGHIEYTTSSQTGATIRIRTSDNTFIAIRRDTISLTSDNYVQIASYQETFSVGSNITASSAIITNSDERLKENIESIDLSKLIDEIKIKKFDYLSGSKNNVGVIAQDYENSEYRDILLSVNDKGFYAVNYNAINMALVQKVQQQETKLNELEKEIKKIKELIKND